jgi:hypothetical protein
LSRSLELGSGSGAFSAVHLASTNGSMWKIWGNPGETRLVFQSVWHRLAKLGVCGQEWRYTWNKPMELDNQMIINSKWGISRLVLGRLAPTNLQNA